MEYYQSNCPDCGARYTWTGWKTGMGKTAEQLAAMNKRDTTCEKCGSTNLKTGLDHGSPEAQALDAALGNGSVKHCMETIKMSLNGEERGIADLHRCQIQGYLKSVKATLYSLKEDDAVFKHLPKTHIQIGNLLSQLKHVMAECDDEFLTQAR